MKTSVHAWEIETLLDELPETASILSLDCFDTLIWRNANRPVDVFHELTEDGQGMQMRVVAEKRARKALIMDQGRKEVSIEEIYHYMSTVPDDTGIEDLIRAEMEAEVRHCFAFGPVARLIASAKQRGLKVIIVSDTYWHEAQLRELISRTAGEELLAQIDHVFCSCDYGLSKGAGLFRNVLADLQVSPSALVHLGDNQIADQIAPGYLGISGVHFIQFQQENFHRLRLESVASTLIEKDARRTSPVTQPHRPTMSLRQNSDPVTDFGFSVLGPILRSFADWIALEADAIEVETGKKPKLLFLMRDGYLPAMAFKAAYPERADEVKMVEISRFTGYASSFHDKKAIKTYLLSGATELGQRDHRLLHELYCRQLLFLPAETSKIAQKKTGSEFVREVLRSSNVAKIQARSEKFANGLEAHLRMHGVEDGDAVILVDLGYAGSVQNAISPVLQKRMNLDIHGRYLLLREQTRNPFEKKGLLDIRHYEISALYAMCQYIALMEQFCTVEQGSVINYDRTTGEAKRKDTDIKGQQNDLRGTAQAACLDFIRDMPRNWVSAPASFNEESLRTMAAAALTRVLFLPTTGEVEIFQNFNHDVNLGLSATVKLIDPEAAAEGLRRNGLFYASTVNRMYLPGELQQGGISSLLSLFATSRFGLDLRQPDFQAGGLNVPVLIADETQHAQLDITAYPTSDGYYQALIPVVGNAVNIAVMAGQICDWFQIEEACFHPLDSIVHERGRTPAPAPILDGMQEVAPGLYHCQHNAAFLLFNAPESGTSGKRMLSLVLRPIVQRQSEQGEMRKVA